MKKDKTSKFGRLGYCKVCTSTRKEKEVLEDGLKRCSKCKEIKATSDFIKDLQKADGFRSDCKVCTRIDYYKRNNIEFKEPRIRPEKEDGKKYCPKCDKNVLFSYFNKDISTKSYNNFHIVKKKADNWLGFTIGIPKNNYYNQSYKLKFNINKKIDDIK